MPHSTARKRGRQIEMVRQQFAQTEGLAFADVLPAEQIERVLQEEKATWREKVFTPPLTLWAFLGQVISPDGSCRKAVARVMAWLVSRGEPPCRPETDPYCKARQRLPEALFTRLMRHTGRALQQPFEAGDVLLTDRYFSGYFDIAYWKQRGVDVVTRLHQRRTCDMRCGRKLGRDDHVVVLKKPQRPTWMDEATYAQMPDELELREVRVYVTVKGFRTEVVVVVTTLLDAQAYTASDLAELYRMRWHAELDLRSLKTTLGM